MPANGWMVLSRSLLALGARLWGTQRLRLTQQERGMLGILSIRDQAFVPEDVAQHSIALRKEFSILNWHNYEYGRELRPITTEKCILKDRMIYKNGLRLQRIFCLKGAHMKSAVALRVPRSLVNERNESAGGRRGPGSRWQPHDSRANNSLPLSVLP